MRFILKNARYKAQALLAIFVLGVTSIAAPTAMAADQRGAGPAYRIAPEDVLEISVWREEDLQREVIVRPDGGVSFPLAGDIQAAGLTPVELEAAVAEKLKRYIPEAVVTVSVLQVQGLRVYVQGKVRSPGQFLVGRYVDVLQALTLAGGLTPFADGSKIKILRRRGGEEQVIPFNYKQVERGNNLEQNIILQADDTVIVP